MKRLALLLIVPFLVGCSHDNQYKGKKIELQYVEEGSLVVVDAKHMFDEAFTNKIDSIYYIGDDTCKACQSLKTQLTFWCKEKHANIYEIEYTKVDEDGLKYLIDATVGYYGWTENSSVPATYFFMQGSVVFKGDDQNTVQYLNKYVEIINS